MTKTITSADLQGQSLPELRAMFRKAQRELVQSEHGSPERQAALVRLDAISLAMAQRMRL